MIVKAVTPFWLTICAVFGVMEPLAPADGVTVYVLSVNIAFSVELPFMLKVQLPVPVHDEAGPIPPDQAEKNELTDGVAVRVTIVPEL